MRGAPLTRERRLELGLGAVLVATILAAGLALWLPRSPLDAVPEPPPAPSALPAVVPEEAPPPEAVPPPEPAEVLRDLWDRIDALRDRGVLCGGRPLPPVPRLRGSAPLDEAAAAAEGEPDARVKAAKFRGKLVREVRVVGPSTPADAVRAWLASPADCAALMDPVPTHGGAAVVPDPESGGYAWIVVLGRKR